jgi:DeoR family fructose operon transcriptional repressor
MPSSPNTLLPAERQKIILELLEREGSVRNAELKELLKVTVATVRADLRELESAGACVLTWGGAVAKRAAGGAVSSASDGDVRFWERSKLNMDAKRAIGARAAQLVEDGQTIIIDSGSTTMELVRNLPPNWEYLRIVTPALDVASIAAQFRYIELVMTGGVLRNRTRSLIGAQVLRSLEAFNADWVFLAAGGFSITHGATISNSLEGEVKRAMLQRGAKLALMVDSSKFGVVLALSIVPLSAIDYVITDKYLADADAAAIEAVGPRVLRA